MKYIVLRIWSVRVYGSSTDRAPIYVSRIIAFVMTKNNT